MKGAELDRDLLVSIGGNATGGRIQIQQDGKLTQAPMPIRGVKVPYIYEEGCSAQVIATRPWKY